MRPSDLGNEFWSISGEERNEVLVVEDFSEVGADWVQEEELEFNISQHEFLIEGFITAREDVVFLEGSEFEKTVLEDVTELHGFEGLFSGEDTSVHFVGKGSVVEFKVVSGLAFSELANIGQDSLDPSFDVGKSEDGVVGGIVDEVGIVKSITGISEGDSGSIGTVFLDGVLEGHEVTQTLGHLFSVNVDITVAEETSGPHLGVFPHSLISLITIFSNIYLRHGCRGTWSNGF